MGAGGWNGSEGLIWAGWKGSRALTGVGGAGGGGLVILCHTISSFSREAAVLLKIAVDPFVETMKSFSTCW